MFEDARDVRFFLSRLARAVRAGSIEVHAYCVMSTHFHLLVRSRGEGLSLALARVLNDYVRWFNRGRKRDGSLFRGRFRSRPVDSLEYRRRLVSYIDGNSVLAGVVAAPALYPHGSARHYARGRGPLWLERSWIEQEVRAASGHADYDPTRYGAAFGSAVSPSLVRVIERRVESGARSPDPLDDLLGSAPERVLAWMRRKAALADGTRIGLPLCDALDVVQLVAEHRARRGEWPIRLSRSVSCGWRSLRVALLRDLCASSWAEIGASFGAGDQAALRAYRLHSRAIDALPEYAHTTARVSAEALRRCYGTEPGSTPPLSRVAKALPSSPGESGGVEPGSVPRWRCRRRPGPRS